MKQLLSIAALAAALTLTVVPDGLAHPEKKKRPQTITENVWTSLRAVNAERTPHYRHPPGNVRAEDMRALFGNTVMVIDQGRRFSSSMGLQDHALKIVFMGRDGRYAWCSYDRKAEYIFADETWAPIKVKHDGRLWPRLGDDIKKHNKQNGHGPLYDGTTGQVIMYARQGPQKTWIDWDVGHLQERLPRAVYTLCPDFPPAEELGVEINEQQTAVTYDKLIAQDPGRRILRPDLITPEPTESAQ